MALPKSAGRLHIDFVCPVNLQIMSKNRPSGKEEKNIPQKGEINRSMNDCSAFSCLLCMRVQEAQRG